MFKINTDIPISHVLMATRMIFNNTMLHLYYFFECLIYILVARSRELTDGNNEIEIERRKLVAASPATDLQVLNDEPGRKYS